MVVHTSGSRATQIVTHCRDAVRARSDTEHWDLRAGTKAVLTLPTSFVAGQAMLIRAIEGAWELDLVEPSATPSWNEAKDFVALTPHQAQGWLQHGHGKTQKLLLGGGPISASLAAKLLQSGRIEELWESYGLSESITHVATRKIDSISDLKSPFTSLHPRKSASMNEVARSSMFRQGRCTRSRPTTALKRILMAVSFGSDAQMTWSTQEVCWFIRAPLKGPLKPSCPIGSQIGLPLAERMPSWVKHWC